MVSDQPRSASRFRRRLGWLESSFVFTVFALVVQLAPDAIHAWRNRPRSGHQVAASVELELPGGARHFVRYLFYLPKGYTPRRYWPLLLYLHGAGERGSDVDGLAKHCLPSLIAGSKHLPMVIVMPLCPEQASWQADQLQGLLDHMQDRFSIDCDRIYAAGYSMGGSGVWELAYVAPGRFAAIVPVCGVGRLYQSNVLTNLPVWAFHGAKDDVVPLERSQEMVDAINASGGRAKLTVIENEGHAICKAVFSRDDLFEWLLQQRRPR